MPINLQGSGPITEGWGAAPQLDAPALGSLVASILANKLARDKMTQESIADTIKNVREERQSGQYLEAMKAAGLVPKDYDAGGFGGAKLGTGLAAMIQRKNEFEAREKHRRAMEARPSGRGSRGGSGGGGSGGGVGTATPDTIWDDQGREWRHGPGGRWIPMKPAAGTKTDSPKLSPTERGWAAPSIPGLSVNINAPDEPAQVLPPDVPPMPEGTPQPAAAETGGRIQSDKAGGHAPDYGVPSADTGNMSADDVKKSYQKGDITREQAQARLKQLGFTD